MKQQKNKKIFYYLSFACIFLFTQCKSEEEKEEPSEKQAEKSVIKANITQTDSIAFIESKINWTKKDSVNAAKNWFKIDSLYTSYFNIRVKKYNIRKLPIDSLIGQAYVDGFRHISRSGYMKKKLTCGVDLDVKTIAFFIKYLMDNNEKKIRAELAQFDFGELSMQEVTDANLESDPDRDNRYTLIFGIPKTNPKKPDIGINCFLVNGYRFYDDWNDQWPPKSE